MDGSKIKHFFICNDEIGILGNYSKNSNFFSYFFMPLALLKFLFNGNCNITG